MNDVQFTVIMQRADLHLPRAGYTHNWLTDAATYFIEHRHPWSTATNAALVAVLERLGMKSRETIEMTDEDEDLAILFRLAGLEPATGAYTRFRLQTALRTIQARPDPLSAADKAALDAISKRLDMKNQESIAEEDAMADKFVPEEKDSWLPTSTGGSMTDEELTDLTQKAGLWTTEKGFTKEWLLRSSRVLLARRDPLSIIDREALNAILERSGRKDPESTRQSIPESTFMEDFMANVLRKAYPPPEEKDAPTSTPQLDPELATYLKQAGYSKFGPKDVERIWLSNLVMLILRKGAKASVAELEALGAIIAHLLDKKDLEKVCRHIKWSLGQV